MADQIIRFGISDGMGNRAATWRLWTPSGKSDVYLACRGLGGILKASLHESGRWHVAYSQTEFEEHVQGAILTQKDRFLDKWPRPKPFAANATLAFRIVTPHSALITPIGLSDKSVTWIPNCPPQQATEVDIVIIPNNMPDDSWPGQNKMETKPIGSLTLANREVVWLVHRVVEIPDLSSVVGGQGTFYRGRTREDLKNAEYLRALVFGEEPDGSRVIYDCAVTSSGA